MSIFSPIQIVQIQAFGIAGPGSVSIPGVKVGDVLLGADQLSTGTSFAVGFNGTHYFRCVIVEDDVIEQMTGNDFHNNEFNFIFLRLNQSS
jgi:hypothetical protein